MADEPLEQKVNVNAPQQTKEEEKKPVSVTQSALEEIVSGVGTAANLAVAGGLPLVADRGIANFKGMGGFGATSTSAGLYFGGDKKGSRAARLESIVGTAFAVFANYTFGPISALGAYAKAALVPLWQLAANAFYMTTDHIVKKKTLSGLAENFKQNYKRITKKVLKYLTIPAYLATFLPLLAQIPALAVQAFVFKKYIADGEKEPKEEKDKTPYYVAASKVMYKLGYNLFYAPLIATQAIGSGLRDFFKKTTPAPVAKEKPA